MPQDAPLRFLEFLQRLSLAAVATFPLCHSIPLPRRRPIKHDSPELVIVRRAAKRRRARVAVDVLRGVKLGEGSSILITGWATVKRGLNPVIMLDVEEHEIGHALGLQHTTAKTQMNPIQPGYPLCMGRPEVTQGCFLHKCGTPHPECDGGDLVLACDRREPVCAAMKVLLEELLP